ncbi:AsmA family protein [Brucella thiophenivorans]|uniref:AsmA-like C-terminal region family protein n=1 Tax=Brucella thiophenivorans TaxID=571255 RepID=A0A256FK03_9HYPH|nr:AsmA family protein [Brucella thiophenivorans]OYR15184.1 asmA-like C-terminal region family protein [Brucella thiophenivorans]
MRWPRFTRLIIALIILGAAALATLLAIIPFIVSTDAIRIRVAQEISAWTGYSVELREAPRLRVFPVLRASLDGVTLSKLSDQGAKPFMTANRIEVELSPLDALMGRLSFSETQIVRPNFNLGGTVNNFSGLLDAIASSNGRLGTAIRAQRALQQNGADDTTRAAQQASQPFGRVVIRDGIIAFNDPDSQEEPKEDQQITKVNATLEWPRTSSAATLRGSAQWRGEATQFNLTAAQALPLLAGGNSDLNASFTSNPVNIIFDGKANISNNRFFEGSLSAKTPNLSKSVRWLGLPPIAGSTEIGAFSLDSTITSTPQRLKFDNVEMTTDESPAKGVIEIGFEQDTPAVTGTLAFDKLDLRRLFSIFVPLPVSQARSPSERDPSEQDNINTSFIDRAELDLRLSAQTATAGPVAMTGVAAAVQIRGGRAMFDIGDAKAFNGILQANLQLVRDLKTATGELRFNASDIDSSQLFAALGFDKPFINGKGNVSLFMKGPANRWSGLLTNAQGNVSVELNNGQMQGFSVQDFLTKAQSQGFFALERQENVSLAFNRLDLKANLSDGVATLENARLATNDGTLSLAGIVPFVDRSLALSGEVIFPDSQPPQQQNTDGQQAETTPSKPPLHFFVGGSWDRPFISPSSTRSTPGQ